MMDYEYIDELLKPELEKLEKDTERLQIQIETCEEMIVNCNMKLKENEAKKNQIKLTLFSKSHP